MIIWRGEILEREVVPGAPDIIYIPCPMQNSLLSYINWVFQSAVLNQVGYAFLGDADLGGKKSVTLDATADFTSTVGLNAASPYQTVSRLHQIKSLV